MSVVGDLGTSVGWYGSAQGWPVEVNVTGNWAAFSGTNLVDYQHWWSLNLETGTSSGPFESSFSPPLGYGSDAYPNWAGLELRAESNGPEVTEATGLTQAVPMSSEPGAQILPEDTSPVDSVGAVWVGLSPCAGGGCSNGVDLVQTGYTFDATHPSSGECTGAADGCDYGLWWEAVGTNYQCLVNGAYTDLCPAVPYSGNPTVTEGTILGEFVWQSSADYFSTEVYDDNTNQEWGETVFEGAWYSGEASWSPTYADYILETPPYSTGSVTDLSQVPGFGSETIDFENGLICSGGSCVTPAQAYAVGGFNNDYLYQGVSDNTLTQMVTSDTYWGVVSTYQAISWLSSAYNFCYMNPTAARCNSSGGGGCVDLGTPLLTPSGYVAVQRLRPGALIDEFNFSSQSLEQGTLISANSTTGQSLIDINNGLLYLTPTDQPIYVYNSTFEGWIRDPESLTTADHIFDPVSLSWTAVTSVVDVSSRSAVFNVETSGANNFVANGALLDAKGPP